MSSISRRENGDTMSQDTAEVLRKARALIDAPEKWTMGVLIDHDGCLCPLGAIAKVTFGRVENVTATYEALVDVPAVRALAAAMPEGFWSDSSDPCDVVYQANDRTRSHDATMAAFDQAIATAEAGA